MTKSKTPKDGINTRLLMLKSSLQLGQNEFCKKADISTATYHSIKNGAELRPRTVKKIAAALNANPDFIFTGEGEKFLPPVDPKTLGANGQELTLLEKALAKLDEQLEKKDKLIDHLTQIILNMGGPGGKTSFLNPSKRTGKDAKLVDLFLAGAA